MKTINWTMFSELHEKTNEYTIRAEELSSNYYANLQMMKEERDCYSHLCSIYSSIGGDVTEKDICQAEEALVHQYRALYDSMDWLSLVLRQQIEKTISRKKYFLRKKQVLSDSLLKVKELSDKIADYRMNKDTRHITDDGSAITAGIKEYFLTIKELDEVYDRLLKI